MNKKFVKVVAILLAILMVLSVVTIMIYSFAAGI